MRTAATAFTAGSSAGFDAVVAGLRLVLAAGRARHPEPGGQRDDRDAPDGEQVSLLDRHHLQARGFFAPGGRHSVLRDGALKERILKRNTLPMRFGAVTRTSTTAPGRSFRFRRIDFASFTRFVARRTLLDEPLPLCSPCRGR